MSPSTNARPSVGLFVTCLVDLFRPNIGFAAVKLLEAAGCDVSVPTQTCCGQPAYNTGDTATAVDLARQVIDQFDGFDYVVAPSGSCAGMLAKHYRSLFADDRVYRDKADRLAHRTRELMSFLVDDMRYQPAAVTRRTRVTYHDSCSGLREMEVKSQPRALLESIEGLEVAEMSDSEVCCGFGGTFCVKYADISTRMVSDKVSNIEATHADWVLGGDLGCLLNIAGRLRRTQSPVRVYHVAEVVGDMIDVGPIGGDPKTG